MTDSNSLRKKDWKSLVVLLLITLGGGAAIAFITNDSMDVYDTLKQPFFAPPAWLFPVAWTILYAAMSVSAWFILRSGDPARINILTLYFVQLAVNLIWPVLFFVQEALGLAFVWLLLLLALALLLTIWSFRISRIAGWLLVPYLAWLAFAAVLNFSIAMMNQ